MPPTDDFYAVLGIDPACDFAALKKAYYRRAMACHPDRHGGDRGKEEEFKRVVAAFHVLSDPLQRRRYDAGRPAAIDLFTGPAEFFAGDPDAILDTFADDILEEMIVGNTIPERTSLATLLLDLERTERFCLFREGKNLFYRGELAGAARVFTQYLADSPDNILARYFLGRCGVLRRDFPRAEREFAAAVRIAGARQPPLHVPRIRRELHQLRKKHLGLLARIRAFLAGGDRYTSDLTPEEEMRRAVSRTMTNLVREERRRRRGLPGTQE
jgi:curved DNA-binding protein CbpA